jgi:hypothetical protein
MVLSNKYKVIILNLIGGLSIFFALIALRLPILINSDLSLTADEGIMAYQILDLYKGNSYFAYYDVTKYFGITNGLAAFPFFLILGVGSLAFKLPPICFYALYILSTYWLVKKIYPQAALTVILLMIFSSTAVLSISSLNYGVVLVCFLGNLMFLSFLKVKETGGTKAVYCFLLGFYVGFAIYTFTYSIVYIGSILILFVLSSNSWGVFRAKISIKMIVSRYTLQKGGIRKFISILDAIILFFILTVLFSYVFGGFGIDIAGISIMQSNELHKPVGQLLVLVIFRICLFRQDVMDKLNSTKRLIQSTDPLIRRSILFGLLGFAIGIAPRTASIFTGETTTGGQGFDVDFVPTNLVNHFWQLMTHYLPDVLGLWAPILRLFDYRMNLFYLLNVFLIAIVALLISRATVLFIITMWKDVKDIFRLKALSFNPAQFLLVLPILICAAVIVSQGPPATRYLFPLHGVVSIWVAIYLKKICHESKIFFISALVAWCMFSAIQIHQGYVKSGTVQNFSIIKLPSPYSKILDFCKEHKILHAYSDFTTSAVGTFLSKGNVQIAEYTKSVWGWKIKERLAEKDDFSIIIKNENHLENYQKYLDGNLHSYSKNIVKVGNDTNDIYYVFSNFQGEKRTIDRLRSLIVG